MRDWKITGSAWAVSIAIHAVLALGYFGLARPVRPVDNRAVPATRPAEVGRGSAPSAQEIAKKLAELEAAELARLQAAEELAAKKSAAQAAAAAEKPAAVAPEKPVTAAEKPAAVAPQQPATAAETPALAAQRPAQTAEKPAAAAADPAATAKTAPTLPNSEREPIGYASDVERPDFKGNADSSSTIVVRSPQAAGDKDRSGISAPRYWLENSDADLYKMLFGRRPWLVLMVPCNDGLLLRFDPQENLMLEAWPAPGFFDPIEYASRELSVPTNMRERVERAIDIGGLNAHTGPKPKIRLAVRNDLDRRILAAQAEVAKAHNMKLAQLRSTVVRLLHNPADGSVNVSVLSVVDEQGRVLR